MEGVLKHLLQNKLVRWVVLPLALVYGLYQLNYPTCTFRYKITAEIMTPLGLKSESSVVEVSYRDVFSISGAPNRDLSSRGEAVFFPIDEKRLFVVTLTNMEAQRAGPTYRGITYSAKNIFGALDLFGLPLKTFGMYWNGNDERALCRQVKEVARQDRRFTVPFENLPTLVVFNDINDPDSVKVVQPDNLSAVLGEGYRLQNVWLEMTGQRPTQNGMQRFPWWEKKLAEQKNMKGFGEGETLINNILDRAFRLPGIWPSTQ